MPTDAAYWTVVAQVVPVLALALVLEMRRSAGHWNAKYAWQRRAESTAYIIVGLALYSSFGAALGAIRGHRPMVNAAAVSILLQLSFSLLALNPLYYAAISGNQDLVGRLFAGRLRRVRRRLRKRVELSVVRVEATSRELEETQAFVDELVARAQVEASRIGLLGSTALEWRDDYLGRSPHPEEFARDLELGSLDSLVAAYDEEPSIHLAARLRRIKQWQVRHLQSDVRARVQRVAAMRLELEILGADIDNYRPGAIEVGSLAAELQDIADASILFPMRPK
jgi:hypothetical protein